MLVRCASCERLFLLDRLLSFVRVTPNGCWEYRGKGGNGVGYKTMSIRDKRRYVHIISFKLHGGRLRKGHEVCHSCDNPPCINPGHLFSGTHGDNIRDMWSKGRASEPPHFYGIKHPLVTRTSKQVRRAIALRTKGVHQRVVAHLLGVGQGTIWRWVHGHVRSRESGVRKQS